MNNHRSKAYRFTFDAQDFKGWERLTNKFQEAIASRILDGWRMVPASLNVIVSQMETQKYLPGFEGTYACVIEKGSDL